MSRLEINATEIHRAIGCGGYLAINSLDEATGKTQDQIEGIAAHEVMQLVLNGTVSTIEELIDRKVKDFIVTVEMTDHLTPHIEHIQARGLTVLTEENLHWTTPLPSDVIIRCRADQISYDEANKILYIDDPKYGWKITEPYLNWQLIAYAIGAMIRNGWKPDSIVMTIHQPRPYHPDGAIREWIINAADMHGFYNQIVNRLAELPTTVTTGPHCYKCSRAFACPASRMSALAAMDITTESYNEDLTDLQVSYDLDLLDRAKDALKVRFDALKSLATSKSGVPGWAMKQSFGNRQWVKGTDAGTLAMLAGIDAEDLQNTILISPSKAEKAGIPKDMTDAWTERTSRGFTLVRSDTDKDAKKLFK